MKIRSFYLPSAIFCATLLTACGGNNAKDTPATPATPAAPTVLTSSNFTAVAAQAWTGNNLFLSSNDTGNVGGNSGGGGSVSVVDQVNSIVGAAGVVAAQASTLDQTLSQFCPDGGTFNAHVNLVFAHSFSAGSKLDFSAANCSVRGVFIDGKMNLELTENTAKTAAFTVSFTGLKIAKGKDKVDLEGDSVIRFDNNDTYTTNGKLLHVAHYVDNKLVLERTLTNYSYSQDPTTGLNLKGSLVTKNGNLGSLSYTVETKQAIVKGSDGYPLAGGVMHITAGGSTIKISSLGGNLVKIDYLAFSNGPVTASTTMSWDALVALK